MTIEEFPVLHSSWNKDVVITKYFEGGYTYEEICTFLRLRHGLELTIDQLWYKLKKMGAEQRSHLSAHFSDIKLSKSSLQH